MDERDESHEGEPAEAEKPDVVESNAEAERLRLEAVAAMRATGAQHPGVPQDLA